MAKTIRVANRSGLEHGVNETLVAKPTNRNIVARLLSKNVGESFAIAFVLTGLSYAVALLAGWIDTLDPIEAFAVLTSYSCTYLCVKERRINYPIGALSTAAYVVVFYQADLTASMFLNIYLTPSLVYGWFRWKADADARPVAHVQWRWVPVYLAVTAAFYGSAYFLMTRVFDGTLAAADAVILVGTILAQFLLDNKKIETWIIWAVVNVFAIYTYFNAGLSLAGFQYIFFLANTVYGFVSWQRSMNAQKVAAGPAAAAVEVVA